MADAMRCSEWTRSEGVDPVGTAGIYAGFLLIEWPLPWPRDVSEIPQLAGVVEAARPGHIRVQAVVPAGEAEMRVSLYRWDPDRGRYSGIEASAGVDIAATATALLDDNRAGDGHPIDVTDVLVCGHGRRDRCCGSLGTSLETELRATGALGTGIRLRRTSHTGGHRFAPTSIILPEGTCWGYLDVDSLSRIATRTGPAREQLDRYRGCTGLSSPAVQAVERAVLADVGWSLLGWARAGHEGEDNRVILTATTPSGEPRAWQARVVTRRTLSIPPCGEPPTGKEKTESELAVENLEELTPQGLAS